MHISQIISSIRLHFDGDVPLYQQLYAAIKEAVLTAAILPGMQLPPTRTISTTLGISRQTVINAYAQLLAEGYLRGAIGHGTFVNEHLPINATKQVSTTGSSTSKTLRNTSHISLRGQRFVDPLGLARFQQGETRAFRVSMPGLDLFPFATWARLEGRRWRHPQGQLGYTDPTGFMPLRELLAVYLKAARGITCSPHQIIITSGSQQALFLLSTILLDAGDKVWVESLCYRGASMAFTAAQAQLCPIPVDDEGLDVNFAQRYYPQAKLAYVTPSHQMPLGITMSLQRRLALLAWAQQSGAWIVEDDYDSEYRYSGAPIAALQSIDQQQCVVYVGSFSKVLFPGLRLGYLVAPDALVEPLTHAKNITDKHTAIVPQMVLADFIAEGHFGRHIKRTRQIYGERQATLINGINHMLADELYCGATTGGLDVAVHFTTAKNETNITEAAFQAGLELRALSYYAIHSRQKSKLPTHAAGLLLGFSSLSTKEINKGLKMLQNFLRSA